MGTPGATIVRRGPELATDFLAPSLPDLFDVPPLVFLWHTPGAGGLSMSALPVGGAATISPVAINRPVNLDLSASLRTTLSPPEALYSATSSASTRAPEGIDLDVSAGWINDTEVNGNVVEMLVGNANSVLGNRYTITVHYTTTLGWSDEVSVILDCTAETLT